MYNTLTPQTDMFLMNVFLVLVSANNVLEIFYDCLALQVIGN